MTQNVFAMRPEVRAEYAEVCARLDGDAEFLTRLERFFTEYASNWPGLMAASFMMSIPVVVLFLVLQRYFVRALTEGAVKH